VETGLLQHAGVLNDLATRFPNDAALKQRIEQVQGLLRGNNLGLNPHAVAYARRGTAFRNSDDPRLLNRVIAIVVCVIALVVYVLTFGADGGILGCG